MSKYITFIIGLFIFSSLLWFGSYMSHEHHLYPLYKPISYIWTISIIILCLCNNITFIKNSNHILNIINWILSVLMLVLFYQYIKDPMAMYYGINAVPSFAYITSLIFIIQKIKEKIDNSNFSAQVQPKQSLNEANKNTQQANSYSTNSAKNIGKIVKIENDNILVLDNQNYIHEFLIHQWQELFEPQVGLQVQFLDKQWVKYEFQNQTQAQNIIDNHEKVTPPQDNKNELNLEKQSQTQSSNNQQSYLNDDDYDEDIAFNRGIIITLTIIAIGVLILMGYEKYEEHKDNNSYGYEDSYPYNNGYEYEDGADPYYNEPYYENGSY